MALPFERTECAALPAKSAAGGQGAGDPALRRVCPL
jgi:hypothetical protein